MGTYKPSQMAAAINTIGRAVLEEKTISTVTSNGNVIVTPTSGCDGMSKVIVPVEVSGGGGGGVSKSDVNFYDYDGTVVAAYTAADFANLTEMPANPDRTSDGLTAQGWNWSLADAKAYVAKYGILEIGQTYKTTDGKTHIHLRLDEQRHNPRFTFGVDGTALIEWGDGQTDEVTGTSIATPQYRVAPYTEGGEYDLAISVSEGGSIAFPTSVINASGSVSGGINYAYLDDVISVECGETLMTIGGSAFQNCHALESISISKGTTSIGNNAFSSCFSLRSITLPDTVTTLGVNVLGSCSALASVSISNGITSVGNNMFSASVLLRTITMPEGVTSIGNDVFNTCNTIKNVIIPDTVTSIGNSIFANCWMLLSATIPEDVTTINGGMFYRCYDIEYVKFKPTTPPTVGAATAFTDIPTDCKILVPTGTLNDYKTAANYPDPTVYTYEEY